MDPRGVPRCSPRHCGRLGHIPLHGAWHSQFAGSRTTLQQYQWEQRSIIHGRKWRLRMYDRIGVHSNKGHGRTAIKGWESAKANHVDVIVHVCLLYCYQSTTYYSCGVHPRRRVNCPTYPNSLDCLRVFS